MLPWLTLTVLVVTFVYGALAVTYTVRDAILDDLLLLALGVLEVLLIAQVVVGIVQGTRTDRDFEAPVFFAYLGTLPLVPPFVTLLALKEKSRWSMGVVAGSALVVGVFIARLSQMWNLHA